MVENDREHVNGRLRALGIRNSGAPSPTVAMDPASSPQAPLLRRVAQAQGRTTDCTLAANGGVRLPEACSPFAAAAAASTSASTSGGGDVKFMAPVPDEGAGPDVIDRMRAVAMGSRQAVAGGLAGIIARTASAPLVGPGRYISTHHDH